MLTGKETTRKRREFASTGRQKGTLALPVPEQDSPDIRQTGGSWDLILQIKSGVGQLPGEKEADEGEDVDVAPGEPSATTDSDEDETTTDSDEDETTTDSDEDKQ